MLITILKNTRTIFLTTMLAASLLAFRSQPKQPEFTINGIIPNADNIAVSLVRDPYGDAETLVIDTIHQGNFRLKCTVKEIMNVSLVYSQGRTRFTYPVILEPGKVTFRLLPTGLSQVTGAKYNNWILGYQRDSSYVQTDREVFKMRQPDAPKNADAEWQGIQKFMERFDIRSKYLVKILHNGKDKSAAVIAAVMLELEPDREATMKVVDAAAPQLGDSSFIVRQARRMNKAQAEMIARRQGKMIGEPFIDFTLPDVNGRHVRLADAVNANKYTLLQFWASWCVPCRAEIPELKSLYQSFHSKGLEIVSFSMDNNKVAWQKASEKEALNWPNVSDLLADKSPVIKSYPVNGIPANVIIDQQGKIVASNLTGKDLEEKIKALFR
ncbi:TlpA disulfide reductase family protein [Chitinophaga sp. Cy-1792]|uniref:TlpA family protein disulfide reductase n=1 Tax=Chitinophaga sp. Cy-1792 TaxID=2608339 RepID=UPI00141E4588|nr:TlpA disulfide reductase family protein [Chitinophaga sp. Cy-1792]NIG53836.1 AhpC/TSA family protein [Chitinophaga sp. Cy-1792]